MKKVLALWLLGGALAACRKSPPPPPEDMPTTVPTASASQAAAPPEPPQPKVPTLVPEPFEATKGKSAELYVIDGARIVTEGLHVGRIEGERVAWIGDIPDDNHDIGGNHIRLVTGHWPDGVDVYYSGKRGYGWRPTIAPLTGKGTRRTFGDDEHGAWIQGTARVGASTIVAAQDPVAGRHFATLRGPARKFEPITAEKGGCKPEEVAKSRQEPVPLALPYNWIGATGAGTFMTVGMLCNREKALAAEVWDQGGKSRIVELSPLTKTPSVVPVVIPGKGDELWLSTSPVIHYEAGTFEALPPIGAPLGKLFVSPTGKLHALAGRGIFRFDAGHWTRVANLPHPMKFKAMGMDAEGTFWVGYAGPAKLRASSGEPSLDDCTMPFVYLGEVPPPEGAESTFQKAIEALATFPALAEISGVEYAEGGAQHFGVMVKSKAQGDAVVAHLRGNLPDPYAEPICFAPRNARSIELKKN
ncbi:hypothetical protein [Polyangium sp. 15x6]|uniref:hypothetical protein n=1 Tax=Polyangium sp. 15x6 TaxID=3042687 RepID=UPI00249B220F|nr:hypothetical protein [Polyangium sp. 15x6]MDI3284936.1 hypothetical protein [Polyangium sp. 15x6]